MDQRGAGHCVGPARFQVDELIQPVADARRETRSAGAETWAGSAAAIRASRRYMAGESAFGELYTALTKARDPSVRQIQPRRDSG